MDNQRPGSTAVNYCLRRTKNRLSAFPLGLLFLALGVAVGMTVYMSHDYKTYEQILGAILGVGLLLLGFFTIYTAIRDSLFPAKSRLANSIRRQLPFPEEAPEVGELFAMVDNDLNANAIWFGSVGIGKEWVLGDDVSAISRIRGIFTVDEIKIRNRGERTISSRIMKLVLIDDRWQKSVTDFKKPQDLKAAADCLALRVPDACRGVNGQYQEFLSMKDDERERFLREFRNRQNLRASQQAQQEILGNQAAQDMILTLSDGTVTSRLSVGLVEQQLKQSLEKGEDVFFLTPTRPIASQGRFFLELECAASVRNGDAQVQFLLKLAPEQQSAPPSQGLRKTVNPIHAKDILHSWLRREVPNLNGWELQQIWTPPPMPKQRKAPPPHLILVSSAGVAQGHETFTAEDIQVAADGLADGSYQKVDLTLPGGYLWFQAEAGDPSDGRCTVRATRADPDKLRFFTTRCPHRQAAAWLKAYAARQFQPEDGEWQEYTKQAEKLNNNRR